MAEVTQDEISIVVKSSADDAAKSVKKLSSELGGLNTALKAISIGAFAKGLKSIGSTIFGFTSKMSDYIQTLNQFNIIMGENTKAATEFVDKAERLFGLDPSKMQNSLLTFQSLGESFGISSNNAYIMSKNLTQLAADMSMAKNISFEQSLQKIKSGFVGEIEPMRAVGIALDKATLQETAYRLGIEQRIDTMTRAQKTELLYYQMMTASQQMQGMTAKQMLTPAMAIRQIQTEFTQLGRAIGSVFIPLLMKVMPYIRALTELAREAAQAIAAMFGFELSDYVSDVSSAGDGLSAIGDDIGDIGKAAKGTTKELKKMLMPFDELNNINFDTGKGSGSGSGLIGTGGTLGIGLPEYDMFAGASDEMRKKIDSIKEGFKKLLPLIQTIGGLLLTVWGITKIVEFIEWIKRVKDAFGLLKKWIANSGLGKLIKTLGESLIKMFWNTNLGKSIKNLKDNISAKGIGKAFFNLAALIGGVVLSIKGFNDVAGVMNEYMETGNIDGWKYAGALGEIAGGFGLIGYAIGGWKGALAGLGLGVLAGIIESIMIAPKKVTELKKEAEELNEVVKKQKEIVDKDIESWKQLADSTQNNMDKASSQADYIRNLTDELDDLVDSNGKVQDSDKTRVDFILNELNEAYGTEYKLVGDQITQNGEEVKSLDELKDAIARVIEKKEAEAIIDATADKYAEALQKKTQFYEEIQTAQENQRKSAEKLRRLFEKYGITLTDVNEKTIDYAFSLLKGDEAADAVNNGLFELIDAYSSSSDSLEKSTEAWEDASNTIIDVERLRTATLQDDYDEIEKSISNLTDTYEINGRRQKATIETKLKEQLETYNKFYDKMTDEQKKAFDNRLNKTASSLAEESDVVTKLTPEQIEVWKELSELSTETYNENIAKVSKGTRLAIETSIGLLDANSPDAIQKWKDLAENSEEEYNAALGLLPDDTRQAIENATGKIYDNTWKLQNAGSYAGSEAANSTNTSFNNNLSLEIYPNAVKLKNTWGFSQIGEGIKKLISKGMGNIYISASSIEPIEPYASGGFPQTGQLFMANEAGPELVGNIGRRTAVANQGQITEGIATATYNAISRALAENKGNGNSTPYITVNVGNERLYSGYGKYQDEQSNMYGITV